MTTYQVRHGDGRVIEVVRGLDHGAARRLVEHERAAGRTADMRPEPRRPRGAGTYR